MPVMPATFPRRHERRPGQSARRYIWVSRRWRDRPELLVFACVVALALRSYTESVLNDYYPWAALAVGVVVAARCTRWRFGIASALAIVNHRIL